MLSQVIGVYIMSLKITMKDKLDIDLFGVIFEKNYVSWIWPTFCIGSAGCYHPLR